MKRELKFRSWKNGFVFFNLLEDNDIDFFGFYSCGDDNTIEQYTGLKDKNGKEIYEGDIVYDIYTGDEVFIVGWDKDKASFMLADTADYPMAYFDEYELDKDLEVIGNVHENPELLEGEK